MPCCNQCGSDKLEVIFRDQYDGTLYQCQTCGAKSDHTEVLEDGPEAETLLEAHEAAIGESQYQHWLAGQTVDHQAELDKLERQADEDASAYERDGDSGGVRCVW